MPSPITRRQMLHLLGVAMASATLDPWKIEPDGDLYVNRRLGLRITRPAGWHFLSTVDFEAARRVQRFTTDDPEILQLFDRELPSLFVTRHPLEHDDLNANFMLWVEPREETDTETDAEYHALVFRWYRRLMPDFETLDPPAPHPVPGATATLGRAAFTYQHHEGLSFPVTFRSLLVHRPDDTTHSWNFICERDENAPAHAEIRRAMRSLRYG